MVESSSKEYGISDKVKKKPLPCIDLMHKVYGSHCPVNNDMTSASQIYEIGEDENDDDEEEEKFEEEDDEETFTENVPETQGPFNFETEFEPHQPMGNRSTSSSNPVEIPAHRGRSRGGGNRGDKNTCRGRVQSTRQSTQTPRRRAAMDSHLTTIESYLVNMQAPIQCSMHVTRRMRIMSVNHGFNLMS